MVNCKEAKVLFKQINILVTFEEHRGDICWDSILVAQLVKNLLAVQGPRFNSWVGKIPREGIGYPLQYSWAFLVVQMLKTLPAIRETWVQSLSWEGSLEEGMATHSSILAWRIPMDRGAWRATVPGGHKELDTAE